MRILHLIPGAFEYFDDIKAEAFDLLNDLNSLGANAEAFTLQYGTASRTAKGEPGKAAGGYVLVSTNTVDDLIKSFDEFDIIHLHCPFLGAAGNILQWKNTHKDKPFVISYYRDFKSVDVFSWSIKLYNMYYLPKLFAAADIIACKSGSLQTFSGIFKRFTDKAVELDDSPRFAGRDLPADLDPGKRLAFKYLILYNGFTS